jgi:hypothetical protein
LDKYLSAKIVAEINAVSCVHSVNYYFVLTYLIINQ